MYGLALKERREEYGISQNELAKKIGIPQESISYIEKTGNPNIIQCVKLADFYKITIDELIGRTEIWLQVVLLYLNIFGGLLNLWWVF